MTSTTLNTNTLSFLKWAAIVMTATGMILAFSPLSEVRADQYCIDNPDDPDCPAQGNGNGNGEPNGDTKGSQCKLDEVTDFWMKEKVEPVSMAATAVQDIIDGLDAANKMDKCKTEHSTNETKKASCLKRIPSEMQAKADAYALKHFGPDPISQLSNRNEALSKFSNAQTQMKRYIKEIAGSADSTCSQCIVLRNWQVLRSAVSWINKTHGGRSDYHVGLGVRNQFQRTTVKTNGRLGGPDSNFSPISLDNVTADALKTEQAVRSLKKLKTFICKATKISAFERGSALKLKNLATEMQKRLNFLINNSKGGRWPADFGDKKKMSDLSQELEGKCNKDDFALTVFDLDRNVCNDPDVVAALAKENAK